MIFTREQADAVLAAAPGPAYLAVPGDMFGTTDCDTCFEDHRTDLHEVEDHAKYRGGGHGRVPPAEWVALTEPCETCGGECRTWDDVWTSAGCETTERPCLDCVSGRRRFPIVVECDCACHRLRSAYPGLSHDVLGQCKQDGSCQDGIVTLGSAEVIELLPIVTGGDRNGEHRITMHGHDPWLTAVVHGPPSLIKPIGAPEPGGYIIHIDNIRDTT